MNKKAQILMKVVELFLALIGIVLLVSVVTLIIDVITPETGIDPPSMRNFERLKSEVDGLMEEDKRYSTSRTPFYLSKDLIIIGYDHEVERDDKMVQKKWSWGFGTDYQVKGKHARRKCESSSCLCIGKKEEGILECKSFDERLVILGIEEEKKNFGAERDIDVPNSLYDPTHHFALGKLDTLRTLFIERSIVDDKVYVYIAPLEKGEKMGLSEEEISSRKSDMRKKLGVNI